MQGDSACKKNILCAFEISRNLPDAQIEICVNCGKKVVYPKIDGEVDPHKYARDHLRDTLQPYGSTYELYRKIYSFDNVKKFSLLLRGKKTKKQLNDEWEQIRKEAADYVGKRTLSAVGNRGTDWN